jgi:hypothetical protein
MAVRWDRGCRGRTGDAPERESVQGNVFSHARTRQAAKRDPIAMPCSSATALPSTIDTVPVPQARPAERIRCFAVCLHSSLRHNRPSYCGYCLSCHLSLALSLSHTHTHTHTLLYDFLIPSFGFDTRLTLSVCNRNPPMVTFPPLRSS